MTTPEHNNDGGLTDLERRLAGWRPTSGNLDRDRMLFEAGRAAGRSDARSRLLLSGFATSTLISLVLGVQIARERSRSEALELAIAAHDAGPEPPPIVVQAPIEAAPDSYLALTRLALSGRDDPPPRRRPAGPIESAPAPTPLLARDPAWMRHL